MKAILSSPLETNLPTGLNAASLQGLMGKRNLHLKGENRHGLQTLLKEG